VKVELLGAANLRERVKECISRGRHKQIYEREEERGGVTDKKIANPRKNVYLLRGRLLSVLLVDDRARHCLHLVDTGENHCKECVHGQDW
jgi:hypothetical protein